MILQLWIDQNGYKQYPISQLRGKYRAKIISMSFHNTLADGTHKLYQLKSSCFNFYGQNPNGLMFSRDGASDTKYYDSPEFILEAYGFIDAELSVLSGEADENIVLKWLLLTLDVYPLND